MRSGLTSDLILRENLPRELAPQRRFSIRGYSREALYFTAVNLISLIFRSRGTLMDCAESFINVLGW